MQAKQLETTDIYKSAVFLCNGGRLADVRFKERRGGIVSFLIEGEDIFELDLDYRSGRAIVNALRFRQILNHLRDVLFTRLRESEGRERDDRKREDRGRKAGR